MKKLVYLFVLLGLVALSQPNQAQFKDWGTKFGIRGSILFPENEFANLGLSGNDNTSFDWFKTSYLAEGFFAVELNNALELSLNAGYGKYAGLAYFDNPNVTNGEYESTIIPVTLRFRMSPFDMKGWNPYFYVGGGIMHYSVDTKPTNVGGVATEPDGWVAIIPAGIGIEVALGERVLLDFGLGGAMSSTYDLDGYRTSAGEDLWDSYYSASLGLTFTGENCKSDKDNDGLGKCLEKEIGTDPNNPDTDGDGLNDGEEYLNYKTNPLQADTDLDGLGDAQEVKTTRTNPLIADTDNDGLKDGEEVNKYKTDPLKADTDGDGLNDGDEVMKYKTDPLKADTDGEGLKDGQEVNGVNVELRIVGSPVETKLFKTDPLKADTDGDGLNDYQEVMTYKTDPLKVDTDGGSIGDGVEVKRGSDPLDPSDDVVKMNVPIVLEGITFAFNKSEITPESDKVLMGALKTLQMHPDIVVEISGHTDNVGSNAYNQKLSQRRSDAVKAWLVAKGIPADRITSVGYGEEHPRVPNDTEDNKRLNRRIEFKRIK
ncbi:MAG: OmpA family protein [Ignavibacterium sp.]|nr:OmpA family protein [Ignavibacterium sp.]